MSTASWPPSRVSRTRRWIASTASSPSIPKSRFIPDAHMARAEAAFNGKYDYAGALVEYEKVMQYPQSDLYGLALFKSAWCQWRLGRSDEAAKRFLQVFQVTDAGQQVSASKRKQLDELQAEALKYLVEVFTEDEKNSADDVYNFLVKAGGDKFAGQDREGSRRGLLRAGALRARHRSLRAHAQARSGRPRSARLRAGDRAGLRHHRRLAEARRPPTTACSRHSHCPSREPKAARGRGRRPTPRSSRPPRPRSKSSSAKTRPTCTAKRSATRRAAPSSKVLRRSTRSTSPSSASPRRRTKSEFNLGEIYFYHLGQEQRGRHALHGGCAAQPQGSAHPRRALQRHLGARAARATPSSKSKTKRRNRRRQEVHRGDGALRPALSQRSRHPRAALSTGQALLRYQVFDAGGSPVGPPAREVPELANSPRARASSCSIRSTSRRTTRTSRCGRGGSRPRPRFRQPSSRSELDTLIVQSVFKQGEQKAAAGRPRRGRSRVPARRQGVSRRTRAPAQACVNAEIEVAEGGRLRDDEDRRRPARSTTTKTPRKRRWARGPRRRSFKGWASSPTPPTTTRCSPSDSPKSEHDKDAAYNAVLLRTTIGDYDKSIADGKRYRQQYPTAPRPTKSRS